MAGAMGWGKWALAFGLATALCAKAWAANPDGKGFLQLDISGLTDQPYQAGNEQGTQTSGRLYHEYVTLRQDLEFSAYAALPLNRYSSLELESEFGQLGQASGRNDPLNANHYDEYANEQTSQAYVAGRIYVAALFGHDWDPDRDHPEGVLGWPVLWVQGHCGQSDTQYSFPDNAGFFINSPADLQQEYADLALGVVLPLDQQSEVDADFTRNLLNMQQQGGSSSSNLGDYDVLRMGASHDIVWRDGDPAQPYFPRLGRPGRLRLAVGASMERRLANDGNFNAGLSASVAAPLGGAYAAELGWSWTHLDSQGFDNRPDFTATQRNDDEQRLNVQVRYAFGDAASPAPDADPPAPGRDPIHP